MTHNKESLFLIYGLKLSINEKDSIHIVSYEINTLHLNCVCAMPPDTSRFNVSRSLGWSAHSSHNRARRIDNWPYYGGAYTHFTPHFSHIASCVDGHGCGANHHTLRKHIKQGVLLSKHNTQLWVISACHLKLCAERIRCISCWMRECFMYTSMCARLLLH